MIRNALTVDVEEWFHICGVPDLLPRSSWDSLESRVVRDVHRVLDLFDRYDAKATFFVLGYVAERHPELIREMARRGHEVASHGMEHVRLYEETPGEFRQELRQSLDLLGNILGERPVGFRAAEWSIRRDTLWALDVIKGEGLAYDSSMTSVRVVGDPAHPEDPHLQMTRGGPLPEFPPFTQRYWRYLGNAVPLGCGWGLRFIRNAKIRRAIQRKNRRGIPACLVIHPWELDPEPPRVELPFWHHFVHYARLGRLRRKLPRLLGSLPWDRMDAVVRTGQQQGLFAEPPIEMPRPVSQEVAIGEGAMSAPR